MWLDDLTELYSILAGDGDGETCRLSAAADCDICDDYAAVLDLACDGSVSNLRKSDISPGGDKPIVLPLGKSEPRTSGIRPCLLSDNFQYVFGPLVVNPKKGVTYCKHAEAFYGRMRDVFESIEEESAKRAIAAVLAFGHDLLSGEVRFSGISEAEFHAVFDDVSHGSVSKFVDIRVDRVSLSANPFIMAMAREAVGRCFDLDDVVDTWPRLRHGRVASALTGQATTPLCSVNRDSFESWGLSGGAVSGVSNRQAREATVAFDYIFASDDRHVRIYRGVPSNGGGRTPGGVKSSKDVLLDIGIWATSVDRRKVRGRCASFIANLYGVAPKDSERIRLGGRSQTELVDIIRRARSGRYVSDDDIARYLAGIADDTHVHLMLVSGRPSQFVFEGSYEVDGGDVLDDYVRYCDDLDLRVSRGVSLDLRPFRLFSQLAPLESTSDKGVSSATVRSWVQAMIFGKAFSSEPFRMALLRIRSDGGNGSEVGYDMRLAHRVAILKGYLVRNRRMEVSAMLDGSCDNVGYVIGRAFAVIEHVQTVAQGGKPNSSVRDKYIRTMSVTPSIAWASIFGSYFTNLSLLEKNSSKVHVARDLDDTLGEIVSMLDTTIPRRLSEDEQAMFFLGYQHQRVALGVAG